MLRLAQMLHILGHRGAVALVTGGAVGLLALVGVGLIIAGLWMALALLIGAIWASLLLGVVLLALAAGSVAMRKEQRPTAPPAPPLEEIIFTLGFVAARAILRKQSRPAGE